MKLYAPAYYKNFRCIADKCEHSCCIGWEIDIDKEALNKYRKAEDGYGVIIKESISYDGEPHFKLDTHDRCPHLDENGLCQIILNLGEDHLCNICREHPRFYNFTKTAEVGIGMSCPEAARCILSSPCYDISEEIGEFAADEDTVDFDGRAERSKVFGILRDGNTDYNTRLEKIYRKYRISPCEDHMWLDIIDSLEYLKDDHKELFLHYSSKKRPVGADEYLERGLAYFVYRHCTEAFDAEDFSDRLEFCLFAERLLASMIVSQNATSLEQIAALASILSEEIEYSDDNTLSLMYHTAAELS